MITISSVGDEYQNSILTFRSFLQICAYRILVFELIANHRFKYVLTVQIILNTLNEYKFQ